MTCPDNTQCIAQVNTHCIDPVCIVAVMTDDRASRLRAARMKAGFASATDAAEAFGWGVAGYRHHENGTRNFGLDAAKKYGRAFRAKPGWLLCMGGVDGGEPVDFASDEVLRVGGSVAAGVWREPSEDFASFEIDSPAPISSSKRFGMLVDGHSMNLFYEHGSVLDCVSIFANGVEPEPGDHVIVERVRPDGLRELTVKEFDRRDGRYFLVPRSTKPEFQSEIEIGAPSLDAIDGGYEVRVIGFVVSIIPPRNMRLMERMGKVRR
jgi:SOS-response transcriptional repressor LexA